VEVKHQLFTHSNILKHETQYAFLEQRVCRRSLYYDWLWYPDYNLMVSFLVNFTVLFGNCQHRDRCIKDTYFAFTIRCCVISEVNQFGDFPGRTCQYISLKFSLTKGKYENFSTFTYRTKQRICQNQLVFCLKFQTT